MKIKSTRTCSRKGCNNEFKLYKSTDKFCSYSCAFESQKNKSKKKQKTISSYSKKRRSEMLLYSRKRKTFLNLEENKFCPVVKAANEGLIDLKEIFNNPEFITKQQLTSEVHHKAGRKGKLLNYVPYWLAVSSVGHKWIHANPLKAYELDFLIRSTTI